MMKQIKVLKVTFNAHLAGHEIPAFRGAIAKKAGFENILFHNHLQQGYRYSYPLIQYKRLRRRPAIVCIGEGMNQIHKFFEKRDWSIELSERRLDMKVSELDIKQYNMQVWNQMFEYRLQNWIALNQQNYKQYQQLGSMVERVQYLERKLVGNLLSFAKGIDWYIEKKVKAEIIELGNPRTVRMKGTPLIGFPVHFRSNIHLPEGIGLGKGVSMGYGVLYRQRQPTQQEQAA